MHLKMPRKQPIMTSNFENLPDQIARLFDNHIGKWLFDGGPECEKGLAVESQNWAD
jgi:hypothetical protein